MPLFEPSAVLPANLFLEASDQCRVASSIENSCVVTTRSVPVNAHGAVHFPGTI
jgi:hypothetical protein